MKSAPKDRAHAEALQAVFSSYIHLFNDNYGFRRDLNPNFEEELDQETRVFVREKARGPVKIRWRSRTTLGGL